VSTDHYFSPSPDSARVDQSVSIIIRGRDLVVTTASGTFSADALDRGTTVLLESVPTPPATGTLVDVGCGWGPITLALALESPEASVIGVDVNERARDLTAHNATAHGLGNVQVMGPDDFPEDRRIDCLWSNPPIRIGKEALHELLTTWLNRLAPGGVAYLVVAKQLGSDSLQRWIAGGGPGTFRCERLTTDKGFRVLEVRPL
jgi:16S rRNA (guanine1207-N2)-methyltransferase